MDISDTDSPANSPKKNLNNGRRVSVDADDGNDLCIQEDCSSDDEPSPPPPPILLNNVKRAETSTDFKVEETTSEVLKFTDVRCLFFLFDEEGDIVNGCKTN